MISAAQREEMQRLKAQGVTRVTQGARLMNPTLRFIDSEGNYLCQRLWYHVPRVGEVVALDDWSGTVDYIMWRDDHVTVQIDRGRV